MSESTLATRISARLAAAWPDLREDPIYLDQLGEEAAKVVQPGDWRDFCGASIRALIGGGMLGPCVLRADHGELHQDAKHQQWTTAVAAEHASSHDSEHDWREVKAQIIAVFNRWHGIGVSDTAGELGGVIEIVEPLVRRAEQAEQEVCWLSDLVPLPDREFRDSFWARVQEAEGNGCWEWQGGRQTNGYGSVYTPTEKRKQVAHRVAWQLTFGFIPDGIEVCHRCDNRPCCRPDHLFLGTKSDNMQDCAAKGRNIMQRHPERSSLSRPRNPEHQVRGERQGNSRLTEDQVREMRVMKAAGKTSAAIGKVFGVSAGHVRKVTGGKAWAHVSPATLDEPEETPWQTR